MNDVQLTEHERELIARWLERNPDKAGLDDVRLKDYSIAVWALAGSLRRDGDNAIGRIAREYDVPLEAVEAAAAFYRRHRAIIDNRIDANELMPGDPGWDELV
jgi:uncharacterized protein (DUF433 family)